MGVVDRFEDINGPISILNARTVDDKSDQQPDGVSNDMALTAVYLWLSLQIVCVHGMFFFKSEG